MTAVFGVESVFDDVSARFAAESSSVSVLDLGSYTGSSAPSLSGTPTADACARVRFPTGGTVGVAGIQYQTSVDGGATWSALSALGVAVAILLAGVTLTLGAGAVADGDEVAWTQTGPAVVTVFRFGWRVVAERSSAFRLVFEPGDDGQLGDMLGVWNAGGNPRSLADLGELFTVHVEARDATAPTNERLQYVAARRLFDALWRALYLSAGTMVSLVGAKWVGVGGTLGAQSQAGATIRAVFSLRVPIPDAPLAIAPANASADVATTTADQTDEESVTRNDTP